jgi:uncharacterized protein (DUF488 family)
MQAIKTIGHSNHPIERFVDLLKTAGVALLVDVRSMPYSRRFPQFGKERLAESLAAAGIGYVHEGAALGGLPPPKRSRFGFAQAGKPEGGGDYDALAEQPAFKEALGRLIERAENTTLCLMCAEKEPLDCHRTVLVSRRLAERGVVVDHLLADGGMRPHREVEEALLAKNGGPDLFDDRTARLARAWQARERAMKRA